MKKKLLWLVLSVLCLAAILGAAFVIHADTPAATNIGGHNLSLDDSIYVIYYVDQTVPEGGEAGVLCWYDAQESYTLENRQYLLKQNGTETISGKTYAKYVFPYVAAKMMTTDIYAVSYVKVGDEVTYSALDKYSVLQYCYNKKNSAGALGELVTEILEYGAKAQIYFDYHTDRLANATYYSIKVKNGTFADGTASGLSQSDETVLLKTNLTAEAGYQILWKNSANEVVGTGAELAVIVAKAETYTAVYEEIPVIVYSEGLKFTSNDDGTCYVAGIGTCTDTDINIPPVSPEGDSVIGIGERAFYNRKYLKSITIPDSVISVEASAFNGCNQLQYNIYDNAKYLGNANNPYVLLKRITDTSIISCSIHPDTKMVYASAFSGCYSLKSVTIPDSVISIGNSAFSDCTGLTSVYITNLAAWCAISFGSDDANPLCYANNLYLNGTLVNDLVIPDGVASIGDRAFYGCYSLKSVTIPNSVTSIGNSAFSGCSGLTSVTIPDSVTGIGKDAFSYCRGLTNVIIGNSVNSIENYAFQYCEGLTNVTIPDSVTSIGIYAFYVCPKLQYNTYNNAKYLGNENNLYVVLIQITDSSISSCTIHPDTKVIYDHAFRGCTALMSVTIPNGMVGIQQHAFSGCTGLASVTIPDSVTNIEFAAFLGCESLRSIFYEGTIEQWNIISKDSYWNYNTGFYTIHCTDGNLAK